MMIPWWFKNRVRSILGYLYGRLGQIDQANKVLEELEHDEQLNQSGRLPNLNLSADIEYAKVRIYNGLGQIDQAIHCAKQAKQKGKMFDPGWWQYDVFLKDLNTNKEFQELVKPKG